jgi:uncharacterized protein (DUF1330 family)
MQTTEPGGPMANPITPTAEQGALLAGLPAEEPVVMINLLEFKQPDGVASYERYAREVGPHLQAVGARPLYAGDALAYVVGEAPKPWWDAILVVEYPSPAAFVTMVGSEAYQEVHRHREAALERAELIATHVLGLAS